MTYNVLMGMLNLLTPSLAHSCALRSCTLVTVKFEILDVVVEGLETSRTVSCFRSPSRSGETHSPGIGM